MGTTLLLSRVFLRSFHFSPINYLIFCRVGRARTYLLNEHLTSRETAQKPAYKTTQQFKNTFEQFYGCSSEEFMRKQIGF